MDNTLCKQILVHAGFSIENWGIPGTPEFAENKSLYNQWYYSTHKDQWVDYNNPDKAKSDFQSSFNSGMDSIISGVKSFASLWKSGW